MPTTQSKLSRVSSGFGLSKLTGSRRNRKESGLNKHSLSTQVHCLVSSTVNYQKFIFQGSVVVFYTIPVTCTSIQFEVQLFCIVALEERRNEPR